jgi:hypothetical protein
MTLVWPLFFRFGKGVMHNISLSIFPYGLVHIRDLICITLAQIGIMCKQSLVYKSRGELISGAIVGMGTYIGTGPNQVLKATGAPESLLFQHTIQCVPQRE